MQTELAQSPRRRQAFPATHGEQVPPQSLSVSSPSFTPLPHPAVTQTLAGEQSPVAQSEPAWQPRPTPHVGQLPPPPQSTSVSAPFWTVSVQSGAWQMPLLQELVVQSLPVAQAFP